VIEVAEAIPFATLTGLSTQKLFALKGEVVSRGVKALTGVEMPVFPKRRFQHGAVHIEQLRQRVTGQESEYRKQFLGLYN
jgi:asparagine synthase (glutamine-hydrolysing)